MTILSFTLLLLFFSYLAGFIGALTGLGGGVVVIPALVLLFHINIHYAMGASLISVIATSSGAAAAYMREGYTNIRIGIFLEIGAVIGAFFGALLIAFVSKSFLAILFSLILFFSAYLTIKRNEARESFTFSHPWAESLQLNGSFTLKNQVTHYKVQNVPFALFVMIIAGMLSGLLGIGSGALKVLAMDQGLRLPYKVSTATSNFMIGITAAVSAGVYLAHGYIIPIITFPVMVGVILGSFTGARILPGMHNRSLRILFCMVICLIGLEMFYKAVTGAF